MSQVAYASAGGFAAVRSFDAEYAEKRRLERELANREQGREIAEQNAFRRMFAPKHCRGLEQFTREWFEACNTAFCEAMDANPDTRPSAGALQLNALGTAR